MYSLGAVALPICRHIVGRESGPTTGLRALGSQHWGPSTGLPALGSQLWAPSTGLPALGRAGRGISIDPLRGI